MQGVPTWYPEAQFMLIYCTHAPLRARQNEYVRFSLILHGEVSSTEEQNRAPLHKILEESRGRNERDVAGRPSPREKNRRNVSDLSGQNSEDKTASLPLVRGPANQSRDLDSRAHDDSSISVGLGGLLTGAKPAPSVP